MPQQLLIDSDTHLSEPPDVWTSAVPESRRQQVPHVRRLPDGTDTWFIGDIAWSPMGKFGLAGTDYAWGDGRIPMRFEDLPRETWNADARLAYMDEQGVYAQIVYPNVVGFAMSRFQGMDRELTFECIRVYNDWIADWAKSSNRRLMPVGALPLWDLDLALEELHRTAGTQPGVLFPQHPVDFGLPHINDRHWDPLWQTCSDAKLPINFHVGVGAVEERRMPIWDGFSLRASNALKSTFLFTENIAGIANLAFSGILQRFPDLQFVSVESGMGYVPYLLEACDWQFNGARMWEEHPEFEEPPSHYIKRQMYFTYWFERLGPQVQLDWLGVDRVMLETDFPHPTSLAHAAGLRHKTLANMIDEATNFLPEDVKRKVMWENAAKLYNVAVPVS